MQQSKTLETWVGLFVVLGMVSLFFLAMKVSNLADLQVKDDSYKLLARFQNVGSLRVRAPVSMAGVRVGRVSSIHFDNKTYEALVEMHIEPQFNTIPVDTTANILTAGLLGEQYIGLSAGGDGEFLKNGDEIELSQSALVLEEVISRFLFSKAESGAEKKDSPLVNTAEEPAEHDPHGIQAATSVKPKPSAKTKEKPASTKQKSVPLPTAEKAESDPLRKPKAQPERASEDARAGHKAKAASTKGGGERDADHKNKPVAR
ncbi:MAG: outer membrane lipid asymmetry maintenance protein MlaD [Candidatus Methylumidiphilus sp.]